MQRQYIVKMIGNVSDWLSYAGGALRKVADSAGSTVCQFFRHSRADNSVVNGVIWQKFEFIQAFMYVITCKNEDSIKNEGAREATTYLPL